eukprot:403338191
MLESGTQTLSFTNIPSQFNTPQQDYSKRFTKTQELNQKINFFMDGRGQISQQFLPKYGQDAQQNQQSKSQNHFQLSNLLSRNFSSTQQTQNDGSDLNSLKIVDNKYNEQFERFKSQRKGQSSQIDKWKPLWMCTKQRILINNPIKYESIVQQIPYANSTHTIPLLTKSQLKNFKAQLQSERKFLSRTADKNTRKKQNQQQCLSNQGTQSPINLNCSFHNNSNDDLSDKNTVILRESQEYKSSGKRPQTQMNQIQNSGQQSYYVTQSQSTQKQNNQISEKSQVKNLQLSEQEIQNSNFKDRYSRHQQLQQIITAKSEQQKYSMYYKNKPKRGKSQEQSKLQFQKQLHDHKLSGKEQITDNHKVQKVHVYLNQVMRSSSGYLRLDLQTNNNAVNSGEFSRQQSFLNLRKSNDRMNSLLSISNIQ